MSSPLLPSIRYLPEDPKLLHRELINNFVEVASAVNSRTIGTYDTERVFSGNKLFPLTVNQFRDIYRLVVEVGAINAGATVNTAHNIPNISAMVKLYGVGVDATPNYYPLPFSDPGALNQQILLSANNTNVTITNGAGNPNLTSAIVVIEYVG